MPRSGFLGLRMTDKRRAAMDELRTIARLEGDAAVLDFALGFTLAHLAPRDEDAGPSIADTIMANADSEHYRR